MKTHRSFRLIRLVFLSFALVIGLPVVKTALADHPIDVQRLTAEGKYFEALDLFERLPKRQRTPDLLESAARSAWGLGLNAIASKYLDDILREEGIPEDRAAKIHIMRGTMELQEDRPRLAIVHAEEGYKLLSRPSKMRGAALLLWGDALSAVNMHAQARTKYEQAYDEVSRELMPETAYRIALEMRSLGYLEEAEERLHEIPVSHDRAAEALRQLAEISLERGDYKAVKQWLEKGRATFPDLFLDSWTDYALAQSAIGREDFAELRKIRTDAVNKYPPSDVWITLLQSVAEKAEWNADTLQQ